jgi:hypothetical protein
MITKGNNTYNLVKFAQYYGKLEEIEHEVEKKTKRKLKTDGIYYQNKDLEATDFFYCSENSPEKVNLSKTQ